MSMPSLDRLSPEAGAGPGAPPGPPPAPCVGAARPLPPRQLRFVAEMRRDGQATPAARRAGYSGKSARWAAHRLMRDPRIVRLLDRSGGRNAMEPPLTPALWALDELRRMASANIMDLAVIRPDGALEIDLAGLEPERAAGVREVAVIEKTAPDGAVTRITRLKLADKSLALARLLRFADLRRDSYRQGVEDARASLAMPGPRELASLGLPLTRAEPGRMKPLGL